jgi:hypothetical protein
MRSRNESPGTKVVPFRGEMYQETSTAEVTPPQQSNTSFLIFFCLCMVGMGVALGATLTYNSPEQVQIRDMQHQLQQLNQVKKQLCNGG